MIFYRRLSNDIRGTVTTFASPVDEVREALYGEIIQLEHPPVEQDGHNFVPLSDVAEFLGVDVLWAEDARTATVTYRNVSVVLQVENTEMVVRDLFTGQEEVFTLAIPPAMFFGTVVVPIEEIF